MKYLCYAVTNLTAYFEQSKRENNIFQLRLVSCEMTVYKNIEISWKLCTNNRPFLGTFQMENCILAQLTKYLRLTSFLKVSLQF